MEVVILPDRQEVCRLGAGLIARLVRDNPRAVLGLATGSTPLGMYAELVRMHREEGLDLAGVTTFNLDEYVGLSPSHPCSYHFYMRTHFFDQVNVPPERIHIPLGQAPDIPRYCTDYEHRIREAGGLDLQLLGLGADAHIGFNEPTSSLASRTRIKTLTADTLASNRDCFASRGEPIPRHVITMGIQTIMEARHCLMLATGSPKAAAVRQMVEGPITAMAPASVLQMHARTTLLIDEAAAAELSLHDYYRDVYRNKPEWQHFA